MSVHVHHRGVGDTLTPIKHQLVQKGDSGLYAAVDLTNKDVYFTMEDDEGTDVLTGTANECVVVDATNGKVYYDFQDADVATAGLFYGYFHVYSSGEKDRFPAKEKKLRIVIS